MPATIFENVRKAAASGKSLEQVKLDRPTREWDGVFPKSFVSADHVIEEAYRAVTAPAR